MDENLYISLVYKKLTGEITSAEKESLEKWSEESERNLQLVKSVELAWQSAANIEVDVPVNLEEEFSFLENRIKEDTAKTIKVEKPKQEVKTINLQKRWLSIAATITILVVAGFLLKNYFAPPQNIQWAEIQTEQKKDVVVLADHSKITMNKNSYLKYPEVFEEGIRKIHLEGEAFFEIEQDLNKSFVIETDAGTITVLGTSFNINSYKNQNEFILQVATGRVQFQAKNSSDKIILVKGNQLVFNKSSKKIEKKIDASPNAYAWLSEKLVFKGTPLKFALRDAENLYKVKLKLENKLLENCPLTASFNSEKISSFLEIVSGIFELEVKKVNAKEYQLQKGNCK